jgi:hypothetical protein
MTSQTAAGGAVGAASLGTRLLLIPGGAAAAQSGSLGASTGVAINNASLGKIA